METPSIIPTYNTNQRQVLREFIQRKVLPETSETNLVVRKIIFTACIVNWRAVKVILCEMYPEEAQSLTDTIYSLND